MSIALMSQVWKDYPSGGGEMLLALALADHAHDDGTNIYPSVKHLAEKTRQSERTVQYQLRSMEASGWIILVNAGNGGRNVHREYRISPAWINGAKIAPPEKGANDGEKGATDDTNGAIHDIKGATAIAPASNHQEPSVTINKPKRVKIVADPQLDLPPWMPVDAWDGYVAMRKSIKKPLTDGAAVLAVSLLSKMRAAGEDVRAVLEQSTLCSWQGLFSVKPMAGGRRQTPSLAEQDHSVPEGFGNGRG